MAVSASMYYPHEAVTVAKVGCLCVLSVFGSRVATCNRAWKREEEKARRGYDL